jgi:hypothetical protein
MAQSNSDKTLDVEIIAKLERQFGSRFAAIVRDSPTLRSDLRKAHALGVRIKRWNGKTGAYCRYYPTDRRNAYISIGSLDSPMMKVIYLAHECYHVLYGTTPALPDPRKISRKRYLSMAIGEEARAIMRQTKVAHELWSTGKHAMPAWQLNLMLMELTGGYKQLREYVLVARQSFGMETYEQNYGRIWDQAHRKLNRERQLKLKSSSSLSRRRANRSISKAA